MAAVTFSRRVLTGVVLIVGGALLALAALLRLATAPGPEAAEIIVIIADLAIAAAFVLLAIDTASLAARIALIVAAAGWLLFALGEIAGLPGDLGTVAALAAAGGALVAAILMRRGSDLGPIASIVFLVATILFAVLVFFQILGADLQGVGLLLTLLFAAGLVITGVLLARPIGSRPVAERPVTEDRPLP